MARLKSSANTILLDDNTISTNGNWPGHGEPWNFNNFPDNWNHYNIAFPLPGNEQYISGGTWGSIRNLEGANYAFADGHVKWLKGENIKSGASGCDGCANALTGSNATFCIG